MYRKAYIILSSLILKAVFALEPQCSPFHYQEQMIEKMVKLEILVQKMEDDMTVLKQRVMNELESLEEAKKLLKSDCQTEKTSVNNAFQQVMNENDALMKNISSTFQQMVEADSDEMKKRAQEVEAIKDLAVTPVVVFYAKEVTNTALVDGVTFIYKTIVLNDGSGYDNATGRFTAPFGGTYLFTVQFCIPTYDSRNYVYYAVVLDGIEVKRGVFYDNDNPKCYNADVIVIVKSGSQVWVTCPSAYGSLNQNSNYWNTFSGVLLHKKNKI